MNNKQPKSTSHPFDLENHNPLDAVAKALIVSLAWSAAGLSLEQKSGRSQNKSSRSRR